MAEIAIDGQTAKAGNNTCNQVLAPGSSRESLSFIRCEDIQIVPGVGGAPFNRDCGAGHYVVQFAYALGLWAQRHSHLLAIQYCCNGLYYVDDHACYLFLVLDVGA